MATKPTPAPSGAIKQLQERVEKAAKVMRISTGCLWKYLDLMGIDQSDDSLALLESDCADQSVARDMMVNGKDPENGKKLNPDFLRVKLVRFNAGWKILAGKKASPLDDGGKITGIEKLVETLRPLEQWSDEEVLDAYGPDCDSRITDELRKRIPDSKKIFVFNADDTFNAKASFELFKQARRRQPVPSTYLVDGRLCRTYGLGEFPATTVEECPLHRNVILANGFCEECQASWADVVGESVKRAVRVAVMCGEYKNLSPGQIQELIDGLSQGTVNPLNIKTVSLKHEELEKDNQLPVLRKRFSTTKSQDPLFVEHRSY